MTRQPAGGGAGTTGRAGSRESENRMSLDKSLKSKSALARHRNVLTRAERIDRLKDEVRWEEGTSPFGLPKIVNRKASAGAKDKKAKEGEAEAAPTEGEATGDATTAGTS